MALYLTRAKYSNAAFAGMISNPHDRGTAAMNIAMTKAGKAAGKYKAPKA